MSPKTIRDGQTMKAYYTLVSKAPAVGRSILEQDSPLARLAACEHLALGEVAVCRHLAYQCTASVLVAEVRQVVREAEASTSVFLEQLPLVDPMTVDVCWSVKLADLRMVDCS